MLEAFIDETKGEVALVTFDSSAYIPGLHRGCCKSVREAKEIDSRR